MSRNAIISVFIISLLLIGGWFLFRPQQTVTPQIQVAPDSVPSTESESTPDTASEAEENLITITKDGFSPQNLTITQGETVTWVNSDIADHTVNSASHPTHTVYPPLNLDTIKPGERKFLTFPTSGTFSYHDHLNPALTGSITVL